MFPHARRDPEEPKGPESMQAVGEHVVIYNSDDEEPDCCVSLSNTQEQSSSSDSPGKRSPIELFVDVGEKVEVILGRIGVDINRTLTAKRLRLETNTQKSFEGIDQKMEQVWNSHEDAVVELNEEFAQAFANLFEQWNSDFQNLREKYVKLMNDFQQEEKAFQQCRLVQSKRLKTIKQVHEQFIKNLEEVEKKNDCLLMNIQNELKEEMNTLQRKIIKESRQQEMVALHQSVQSMLRPKGCGSDASK
uniref:synaptonemal complex protein 3-like n=1 Tax=Myodes glareolus TaxID=447135 RepID=UPI002020B271|nr:synaptonemal complex protein 3-like [Myodes glareolus]